PTGEGATASFDVAPLHPGCSLLALAATLASAVLPIDPSVAGDSLTCGNGVVEGTEECDDGNTTSGDGCSATCQLENTSAICAGIPTVSGTAIKSVLVASGLAHPTYVTAPPLDPNRLFIVEQPGRIRLVKNGALQTTPFLDIVSKVERGGGEQGLFSVAFHPDFETNGFFYVNYTSKPSGAIADGDTVVARYHATPTADQADPLSEQLVFAVHHPFANHNGGLNLFGPDGMLYVGLGDGGSGGDPSGNGQNDAADLGKLLRVDVSTLPATPQHFAKGLRNPWRYAFDRATGDLYIADVGQNLFEEIDFVPAASLTGGLNYGWNIMEGRHCFNTANFNTPLSTCTMTGLTLPVLEYCHGTSQNGCTGAETAHPTGCSITGGFVYRGCRMPDLRGRYFYSDFCSGFIRSFGGGDPRWRSSSRPSSPTPGLRCARRAGWKPASLPLANAWISFEMRMLHQSWPHMAQKSVSTSRSSSWRARAVSPSKASSNCRGQLSAARARERSSSHARAPWTPRATSPAWAAIL